MNRSPDYRPNSLPSTVLTAILSAAALAACGEPGSAKPSCYAVTVGDGGSTSPAEALIYSLETEAGYADDLNVLTGINETYNAAGQDLLTEHRRYRYIMPGDAFGYCVSDDEVSYKSGSAVANDK